jgi:hypothetical protein
MKRAITLALMYVSVGAAAQIYNPTSTVNTTTNTTTNNVGIGIDTPMEKLHVNGSVRGNSSGGALRINTVTGYLDLGSMNTSWAHLQTDRPNFYFNKPIYVDGTLSSYSTLNLNLQTNGTTRMTMLNSNGYVGIGTSTPGAQFTVASPGYTGTPTHTSLAFLSQSSNPNGTDLKPALELYNNGGSGYGLVSVAPNNYFSGFV